jgi:hypothetical protein
LGIELKALHFGQFKDCKIDGQLVRARQTYDRFAWVKV